MINPTIKSDVHQANYWRGFITRGEAQKVFDEYTEGIGRLIEATAKLDVTVAYLADRAGVKPEEFHAWLQVKQAELAAKQQQTEAPAETPKVTLE